MNKIDLLQEYLKDLEDDKLKIDHWFSIPQSKIEFIYNEEIVKALNQLIKSVQSEIERLEQ